MEIFRREDRYGERYVRYDFSWYGFGYSNRCHSYAPFAGVSGHQVWINHYRLAPLYLTLLPTLFGIVGRRWGKFVKLSHSGSFADPFAHWCLSIGRVFIGGDVPHWLRRVWRHAVMMRDVNYEWHVFQQPNFAEHPLFKYSPWDEAEYEYEDDGDVGSPSYRRAVYGDDEEERTAHLDGLSDLEHDDSEWADNKRAERRGLGEYD
jgi:hypothetical protein